jgi:hypothetical protein
MIKKLYNTYSQYAIYQHINLLKNLYLQGFLYTTNLNTRNIVAKIGI